MPDFQALTDKLRYFSTLFGFEFLAAVMAIHSTFLGSVKVSGEDAKSFTRKITHGRGTKAASESAANGRKLVAVFAKKGSVSIKLKPAKTTVKK